MKAIEAEMKQIEEKLVGKTIVGACKCAVAAGGFGFIAKSLDGETVRVWVDMDAEGNGPGHLDVETIKEKAT